MPVDKNIEIYKEYKIVLETVSHNIQYLRRRNKMSIDELGIHSGLSHEDINAIEDCKKEPNLFELYRLAKGLETSLMVLVAG